MHLKSLKEGHCIIKNGTCKMSDPFPPIEIWDIFLHFNSFQSPWNESTMASVDDKNLKRKSISMPLEFFFT